MKREDGKHVSSKEEVKGAWKRHFVYLMNGGMEGRNNSHKYEYESRWKKVVRRELLIR